jgi:hypothetical protein
MIGLLVAILTLMPPSSFIVDANAEAEFPVQQSEAAVRLMLNDIYLLRRTMPGVVAITPAGDGQWVYRTERRMPFSEPVKTDFSLVRSSHHALTYATPEVTAPNWMSLRFETAPVEENRTLLKVRVRVRLERENGADIHVFAPVLGEGFISDRMRDDLQEMLHAFAVSVTKELETSPEVMSVKGGQR